MEVEIINFPETKIAVVEYLGVPEKEYEAVKKLVAWRMKNNLPPSDVNKSYGIHYNDPNNVLPSEYRVDICVSIEHEISENSSGIINKTIPAMCCAKARHYGSRENISLVQFLYKEWLPSSNEKLADFPIFFHYVNVGPQVQVADMVTDIYLPII